jgi:hypothetical protein
MAEIGEVLYTKLTGYAGLAALIGSRVYPGQLPQRPTLPAICYTRVSTTLVQTRDNAGRSSLERPRYQFDCWAGTRKETRQIAAELRYALATMPQSSNPRVDVALVQNDFDDYEPDTDRHRAVVDVFIWYEES